MLVVALIALVLLALLLPGLRRNRADAVQARREGLAATLARVERAKAAYAAERHLKFGAPVTMADLIDGAYLDAMPRGDGITYSINPVGTAVTYTFEGEQNASRRPDHAHHAE